MNGLITNAKRDVSQFPTAGNVEAEVRLRNRTAGVHQHDNETDPEFNERYAQFLAGHLAGQGRTGELYWR